MAEPAYTRLPPDERQRQIIEAGAALFAEHAFEEISMREVAEAAGVSKGLLYHYFPNKIQLFKAAIQDAAVELSRAVEPSGEGPPLVQLTASLDAYLAWVDEHARTWVKLVESTTTLPEAREFVLEFRTRILDRVLAEIAGTTTPPPALRIALVGWLAYMDAAILDWIEQRDIERGQLRDMLLGAFAAALGTATQVDPSLHLALVQEPAR